MHRPLHVVKMGEAKKCLKQRNVNFTKIGERDYEFCKNRGKISKCYGNLGEYAICIIGIDGMEASACRVAETVIL